MNSCQVLIKGEGKLEASQIEHVNQMICSTGVSSLHMALAKVTSPESDVWYKSDLVHPYVRLALEQMH